MIRRCQYPSCAFATTDALWFESHQARHLLNGDQDVSYATLARRDHDVSGLTASELERVRRELEASLALSRPGIGGKRSDHGADPSD